MTRKQPAAVSAATKLRCAVYTRKSSEEGLEMEFNSLEAQREACEAYVASQRAEGWLLVPDRYDDGGFSGGTLERPALKRLLADIEAGKVDVVVVYKIDRLSRSLMDFSRLVEVFDQHKVTFVSVTQSFNTTTSMGRLTLNVLLSFAQFEREVIGERIRDKFAASRKRGMWMGGWAPLGYEVKDRKLIVNEVDAKLVRSIFQRFLKVGSATTLARQLIAENVRNKYGKLIDKGMLYKMLNNPVYVGVAVHKGVSYPGEHVGIIDRKIWDKVQGQVSGKPPQTSGCHTGTNAFPVEGDHLRSHRHRHVADAHAEEWQALSLLSQPDRPEAGRRRLSRCPRSRRRDREDRDRPGSPSASLPRNHRPDLAQRPQIHQGLDRVRRPQLRCWHSTRFGTNSSQPSSPASLNSSSSALMSRRTALISSSGSLA